MVHVKEILFLFFSEDLRFSTPKLFGYSVIPLNDENNPVPINAPFIRELCPIAKCDSDEDIQILKEHHMTNTNIATWPIITEETSQGAKDCLIGEAKLAVTWLQCNDLSEVLKTAGFVATELKDVKNMMDSMVTNLEKSTVSLIRGDESTRMKRTNLISDQRKNFEFPLELTNLCEEETDKMVTLCLDTIQERDSLKEQVSDLNQCLEAESQEKGGQVKSLTNKNKQLNDDLSKEKATRKGVEKEHKAASQKVVSLTNSLDKTTKESQQLSEQVAELKLQKAKLEETNRFLVRKGLEIAGSGDGGTAFDFNANDADNKGATKARGDLLDEYDSTTLALRRVAMGCSALRQYESSSSTSSEEMVQVLFENLSEAMKYLKGECLHIDSKQMMKIGDMINLVELKCSRDDNSPMLENFLKGFNGVRTIAQNLTYGNISNSQFDVRERWPLTDEIINQLNVITDAKEILKHLRTMIVFFDCIGPKHMGDLMYDRGVVLNLEFVIKLARRAHQVADHKKAKKSDFTRVFGVLTTNEVDDLRLKFKAMSQTEGEEEALSKVVFKKLINLVCRDNKGKIPKDKDLDAVFDLADDDNSGTVDCEEFLKLYASVKKGEVKGLGSKKASDE